MGKRFTALLAAMFIGLGVYSASAQGPFAAQIQAALRAFVASDQTITAEWTFNTPPVGTSPWDQDLNTTDSPSFAGLIINGTGVFTSGEIGSELVTNPEFTTDASGWTLGANWEHGIFAGAITHTPGATEAVTQTLAIQAGRFYYVIVEQSAGSAGEMIVTLGGEELFVIDGSAGAETFTSIIVPASDTPDLTFTPNTDHDGSITLVNAFEIPGSSLYGLEFYRHPDTDQMEINFPNEEGLRISGSETLELRGSTISIGDGTEVLINNNLVGGWVTPSYSAGDYTCTGGTWTVEEADLHSLRYAFVGNIMVVSGSFNDYTTASGCDILHVTIPDGRIAAARTTALGFANAVATGGANEAMQVVVDGSDTTIDLYRLGEAAFANVTNDGFVSFSITFEIAE